MTEFQAWVLDGDRLCVDIAETPVGAVRLRSWAYTATRVPEYGSAVLLPTSLAIVVWSGVELSLGVGCYAVVPGGARIFGGAGLIIHTPEYRGLAQAGGPAEGDGRLNYIDGCSDTLLVCPARLGEPCLNLLHLPAGIDQTAHTHPSDRIGIILRGAGVCRTEQGDRPLVPGMFWRIPPDVVHSFHTRESFLDVFAWHPDSDFGPSHDAHPMLNRTIVEGVAASDPRRAAIRTR